MSLIPTREEIPTISRRTGSLPPRPGMPGAAQSGGGQGFSFSGKDFLRMMVRRKWLILLSLFTFTAAAVGGTYVWLLYAPLYTAEAYLAVNPAKTTVVGMQRGDVNQQIMDRLLKSYANSIMTDQVLQAAAKDIEGLAWYREASKDDVVEVLKQDVNVSVKAGTKYIGITMTGRRREDITEIVNAVAKAAANQAQQQANASRQATIDDLKEEVRNLRQQQNEREMTIKNLQSQGVQQNAEEDAKTLEFRIRTLVNQLGDVRVQYVQAKESWESLQGMAEEELANQPEVREQVSFDPVLRELENRVLNLQMELERMKETLGPGHKMVLDIEKRLQVAEEQHDAKRQQVLQSAISSLMSNRQMFFQMMQSQYLALSEEINTTDKKLQDVTGILLEIERNKEEIEKITARIEELDLRLTDMILVSQQEEPLTVPHPASVPRRPSMPKYPFMVAVGVILGLVFGFGMAFLLELMDTSIKAPSDVSRRVELPLLGMIPHLDDVDEEIEDMRTAFLTHPNTIVCEAYRRIRTTLMFSGPAEQRRSILVTSPMPEDGRTSVCLNLGHHIASTGGRRVLVVDANFRQPALRKLFPMCPDGGLSSCLVGQTDWHGLLHEVEPNLSIMASGPIPPNPAELLGSEQMRRLVHEFSQEFDQVIFDSAPCLVVSDAAVLSTVTDGAILVVRAGVNTYGIVQRSRDMLTHLGTHIFGVVLNGVRVTAGGYFRKNYETFYEYSEAPQLTGATMDTASVTPNVATEDDNTDEDELI